MKIGFKKILDAFHHLLNHFTNRSGARNSGRSMKKLGPQRLARFACAAATGPYATCLQTSATSAHPRRRRNGLCARSDNRQGCNKHYFQQGRHCPPAIKELAPPSRHRKRAAALLDFSENRYPLFRIML
jgi:hypothetical protein